MVIIAVAALVTGVAASVAWSVRRVRTGARDANDLAAKIAVPRPCCAADWPEIHLDAVVPDPDNGCRVLIVARWPAHPEARALLVLEVDEPVSRTQRLLARWRDADASLSPRAVDDGLVLRRRHTQDSVHAVVLRETACVPETSCSQRSTRR